MTRFSYLNAPQRLSKLPAGTAGCAPFSNPALPVGRCSGSAFRCSGCAFASCAGSGAAAGRIAPAFCLDSDSFCLGSFCLGSFCFTGSDGAFALGVAAVWVAFDGGVGLRLGVGTGSAAGSGFTPIRRDMRSHTPPESDFGSVVFGANRLPNKPLPDELESLADATRAVLPVGSCGGVAGGLAWAGIVPGSETAGDRTPDKAMTNRIFEESRKRGLLVGKSGLEGNVFRVAPALTVERSDVEEALAIIRESFEAAGAK